MEYSGKVQMNKEDLQILDGFRLLDDDFMRMVFQENKEATGLLLNILLKRGDIEVIEVITQKEEKNPVIGGRSIVLDIYARDSEGKNYDVEIQRQDEGADVHRARYHSSTLDTRMLKEKQKFKELHDSYVIFITENDTMGLGLPMYHIERIIRESGTLFNDGSHIIYVNGAYRNDEDPVGQLMHDFRSTKASDMFYSELAKQVRYFKETEGGQQKVCKAIEDMRKRERIETMFNSVKALMESMKWTAEQAMNAMKISEDDRALLIKRF